MCVYAPRLCVCAPFVCVCVCECCRVAFYFPFFLSKFIFRRVFSVSSAREIKARKSETCSNMPGSRSRSYISTYTEDRVHVHTKPPYARTSTGYSHVSIYICIRIYVYCLCVCKYYPIDCMVCYVCIQMLFVERVSSAFTLVFICSWCTAI